jgi:hypothetical protein
MSDSVTHRIAIDPAAAVASDKGSVGSSRRDLTAALTGLKAVDPGQAQAVLASAKQMVGSDPASAERITDLEVGVAEASGGLGAMAATLRR